jgi:hypothetical protein
MPSPASGFFVATGLAGLVAVAAALAAPPAAVPAQVRPVARLACGAYEAVPSGLGQSGHPTRLSIQRDGRLLQSVSDWWITRVDCSDLDSDKTLELLVASHSGGAHCCETLRVWTLEPKAPRKILEYEAGNAGGFEVRDLDGNGRLELLLGDDSFAYFDDLSYACSPRRFPLVACSGATGWLDCTRQFPEVLRAALAGYLEQLAPVERDGTGLLTVKGAALGVLALSVLLGEEAAGLDTIRGAVANEDVMRWLERARPKVRDWAQTRSRKLKAGTR